MHTVNPRCGYVVLFPSLPARRDWIEAVGQAPRPPRDDETEWGRSGREAEPETASFGSQGLWQNLRYCIWVVVSGFGGLSETIERGDMWIELRNEGCRLFCGLPSGAGCKDREQDGAEKHRAAWRQGRNGCVHAVFIVAQGFGEAA
jgi:hypothetical protein